MCFQGELLTEKIKTSWRTAIFNWRTTICGLVVVGYGACLLIRHQHDAGTALITVGVGLINARDS
jgi:hypothetical protein